MFIIEEKPKTMRKVSIVCDVCEKPIASDDKVFRVACRFKKSHYFVVCKDCKKLFEMVGDMVESR